MRVEYESDLIDASTWPASSAPVYDGMSVVVMETGDIWVLKNKANYQDTSSGNGWVKIGSNGGGTEYSAGQNIVIDSSNAISAMGYVYDASDGTFATIYRQDLDDGGQLVANIAVGLGSFAEGYNTTANNDYGAHAEGYLSTASGMVSHAEGFQTLSSGGYGSHAEGNQTSASERGAHAEGYKAKASARYSHAEGNTTTANGQGSHAEGANTSTGASASHAEGYLTIARAKGSGAGNEGWGAHAEGYQTIAEADGAHAEGVWTKASHQGAHAEGQGNVSSQIYNEAKGWASHVEGHMTVANNIGEHAEGAANISHKASDTFGDAGNTHHSIGIGTTNTTRKNAIEIMENGNFYVYGIGSYDGSNYLNASTLQQYISALNSQIADLETRVAALEPAPPQPDDEIWYTTTNGQPLDLSNKYYHFEPLWFEYDSQNGWE